MLARVATFEFADAGHARSVLATVRDAARDEVARIPGWRGVVQLADPLSGRATVIHFLDDEAGVDAAEATFAAFRTHFTGEAAAALAELRRAERSVEVLVVLAREPPAGGRGRAASARAAGSRYPRRESGGGLGVAFWRGRNGATHDDLAVDLGTANTVVYRHGRGVVLFEPSVVAVDERTGDVQAVGEQASRMIGRTPAAIRATRPLRHGVIADFEVTEQMLRYFVRRAGLGRLSNPRVIVCVPTGITEVERRAIEEAALAAGAKRAYLIEEAMAGAIGAGLPVAEPQGSLIVDIGGGTSEIAVIALGGMVVATSLRVGGYELDDAIVRYAQDAYKLLIGQQQAEQAKLALGSALPEADEDERTAQVAGRDLVTGLLRRQTITAGEVREAVARPLAQIVQGVKDTLERTPPELAADVGDRGIVMVGGGALLRGIDRRLRDETGLAVSVAESPLTCVAVGAGRSLEELGALERVRRADERAGGSRSRGRSRARPRR